MASFIPANSMNLVKEGLVFAAAEYVIKTTGLGEKVSTTIRGVTGPVLDVNGIDLPEAFTICLTAGLSVWIKNYVMPMVM